MDRKPYYLDLYRQMLEQARIGYTLAIFGDHLADFHGYKVHKGMDAIHFYLIQKHSWTRIQILAMPPAEILFAMAEEFTLWTMPDDARQIMMAMSEHQFSPSSS